MHPASLPAHRKVAKNVEETGNRFGAPQKDRLKWIPDETFYSSADMLYFPGCAASYTDNDIAISTLEILKLSGQAFTTLGKQDQCCGHPLTDVGMIDQAKKIAEANILALRKSGAPPC